MVVLSLIMSFCKLLIRCHLICCGRLLDGLSAIDIMRHVVDALLQSKSLVFIDIVDKYLFHCNLVHCMVYFVGDEDCARNMVRGFLQDDTMFKKVKLRNDELTIDLHNNLPITAVLTVESLLHDMMNDSLHTIELITGRGKHSDRKLSEVKHAVYEYVISENFKQTYPYYSIHEQDNLGRIKLVWG